MGGLDLAKKIAERGGNLILLNRSSDHSATALDAIKKLSTGGYVIQVDCDLCSFSSVRTASAEVHKQAQELDALVLNAGLMAYDDVRTTDGFDIQMQANHLSHFLLTSLCFDLLEGAGGRVVSHSSGARNAPFSLLRPEAFEKAWAEGSP